MQLKQLTHQPSSVLEDLWGTGRGVAVNDWTVAVSYVSLKAAREVQSEGAERLSHYPKF